MINKIKQNYTPYVLIFPVIVIILLLYAYPILLVSINAFRSYSIGNYEYKFVGLENFKYIFSDKTFFNTLKITFKYTIITVIFKICIGFIIALFLWSDMYFNKVLRFLTLIPWAIQQVTVAVLWKWILDGNYGYLNYILQKLGIISKNIYWLSSPSKAFFSASIIDAWMGIPFIAMIFLSGLNSINKSLYESSMVDGANIFQRFINITIPGIKKIFIVTLFLVTIWTFNSFNVIYILTGGGPMRSTETLIIKVYQEAFSNFNIGASSALAFIIFIMLMIFCSIYLYITLKLNKEE